jgi:hypothetical protein
MRLERRVDRGQGLFLPAGVDRIGDALQEVDQGGDELNCSRLHSQGCSGSRAAAIGIAADRPAHDPQ